uniref:Claudin n=1 Tax=Poecilia reticulata TaxID=8081 RepID=A0A3P9P1L3_POERE
MDCYQSQKNTKNILQQRPYLLSGFCRKSSAAVQMLCVTYGVIGQLGVIVCGILPRWRVSAHIGTDLHEGLWMECVTQSTGQQQCKMYDSMLELPSDLQAARVMTIISFILSVLSLFIMFFGADFTPCVQNENAKPKLILVAGVDLMLAGLLVIIPVSWSAHNTVRDFHYYWLGNSQKRELGESIYIGWAAGVILIQAGVLLCCFGRPRSSSSGGTARYHSNRASGPNDDAI